MRKQGLRILLLLLVGSALALVARSLAQEATEAPADDTAVESAPAGESTEETAPAESGEGVEVPSPENESGGAQAPGISVLVLVLGVTAVLIVGGAVLARDSFRKRSSGQNNS